MTQIEQSDSINKYIATLVDPNNIDKTKTIQLLQKIQHKFGYLSREAITSVANHLRIPAIDVIGIATFYEQFRFNKPGKHNIKVCEGTACHVKGGADLVQTVERELQVKPGETTDNGLFSSERAACLGCCALAPVVVINEKIHRKMTPSRLTNLIKKFAKESKKEDK